MDIDEFQNLKVQIKADLRPDQDERVEFLRAYLKASKMWDMPTSDFAYLIKALDAAQARVAELEETLASYRNNMTNI